MDQKTLENQLLKAAWEAEARAYAPYSQFHVGASILIDGQVFSGCNVENASYGLTVCAERNAVAQAVIAGALKPRKLDVVLVAVQSETPTFPCGACRQVLNEFAHPGTRVFLSIKPGEILSKAYLHDLLPYAFGPEDLGIIND